ncbi:MAG: chemotaxis protein CheX [Magnetococcales bacterium]|nr:chemotaxis protein CheX [Magnetococcales bacterium]
MHEILKETIKAVMEETADAFFPPEFVIVPRVTVMIGGQDKYEGTNADFTAIIGFNGDINGGMNLAAPTHVTLKLASALAGEELFEIDDMATDAFGELANIIAGAVKERLSADGLYEIGLTPPVVAEGNSHKYNTSLRSTKQYFTVGSAPFFVEVFY